MFPRHRDHETDTSLWYVSAALKSFMLVEPAYTSPQPDPDVWSWTSVFRRAFFRPTAFLIITAHQSRNIWWLDSPLTITDDAIARAWGWEGSLTWRGVTSRSMRVCPPGRPADLARAVRCRLHPDRDQNVRLAAAAPIKLAPSRRAGAVHSGNRRGKWCWCERRGRVVSRLVPTTGGDRAAPTGAGPHAPSTARVCVYVQNGWSGNDWNDEKSPRDVAQIHNSSWR